MRDDLDPKGLIRESYLIEGIGAAECRSIFLDWALSVPMGTDTRGLVQSLLERHAGEPAEHPMTLTLRAALLSPGPARRRGGAMGRRS